ncbi:response regulator transcription factor [Colwellia psychrerythraea]|uniref:DNA-binding response regulator n=1 Tax=Colwellia psychrerythraea (strain 34H / ATCC BAA-681) TaxID=167879 RepID=Q47ZK7_COLP3|nr:response regulator transcription factor [Colwellia psychrerythraea]AAZ25770.1 DNA-binding response regulator [Colwellia psychrerythraea 34H]
MFLLPTTVLNEKMHILIIEDDKEIARLTEIYLQSTGYETTIIADGSLAIAMIKKLSPDLILLDLMLPGVDGFELCKQAREFYNGPIIVLTAMEDDLSEVSLLKLGADDYLRKPAKPHIMSARIEALLRRAKVNNEKVTQELPNKLLINRDTLSVTLNNALVDLTNSEFDMLVLLADKSGQTVSREECIHSLRGIDFDVTNRSIDMRISALRKKLNDEKSPYKLIKTIRNKGYLLVNE